MRSRYLFTIVSATAVLALGQLPAVAGTQHDCNGAVCEEVVSSGTTITQWRATVYPGTGYHCRTARFWVDGTLIEQQQVCGNAGLTAYADTPFNVSSGSRLCASYVNEPGYPCITI